MVAVGRYTDNLPSIVNMSRAMADGWGGCSEEDLEEFAREDGVDPLELAARLLRGAAGYIAVLLEVMDDEAVRRA